MLWMREDGSSAASNAVMRRQKNGRQKKGLRDFMRLFLRPVLQPSLPEIHRQDARRAQVNYWGSLRLRFRRRERIEVNSR